MRRLQTWENRRRVPLNMVLAVSLCLMLPACSVLNAEGERRNKLWEDYSAQGVSAERKQNWVEAKGLYKQALDVSEKFGKADLRRTMTLIDYASMLHKTGDDARAESLLKEAIVSFQKWRTAKATDEEMNRVGKRMAICYQCLAQIDVANGREDDAEKKYERALEFTKADYFPKRFKFELSSEYADLLRKRGKDKKADSLVKPLEAVSEGLEATITRTELVDLEWHRYRDEANALSMRGLGQKAADRRKAGIAMCTRKYGVNDSRTLQLVYEYVGGLRAMKKEEEAKKVVLAAIEAHRGVADQPFLAQLYNFLAQLYFEQGNYPAALKSAENGARIAKGLTEGAIQADGEWLAGQALYKMPGRKDEGLKRLKDAVQVRSTEAYDISYYGMVISLSDMYVANNQLAEAAALLKKSCQSQEKSKATGLYAATIRKLSQVYERQGLKTEAAETLAKANLAPSAAANANAAVGTVSNP